jgi:hypothetical protein
MRCIRRELSSRNLFCGGMQMAGYKGEPTNNNGIAGSLYVKSAT